MKPEDRVWRKGQRAAVKGLRRGRRATHRALIQPPSKSSTWLRRHNDWELRPYWFEFAGSQRLLSAGEAATFRTEVAE